MKWSINKIYGGNFRNFILAIALLMVVMWGWGYFFTMNSDAFSFAQQYVRTKPNMIETFGSIRSTRLGIFDFKRSYEGGAWTDKFRVVISGEKKSGAVIISLRSSDRGWLVEDEKILLDE
jgi:hypothetical protein